MRSSAPLSRSTKSRGSGGSTVGVVIMKRTRPRDETAEITSAAGMVPRSRTRPIQ